MSEHLPRQDLWGATRDPELARDARRGWTAHLECAGNPATADGHFDDQLAALLDALRPVGGVVTGSAAPHDRFGATFSVYTDSNSVIEVIEQALVIFFAAAHTADLPAWPIVRSDVMTFAEQDCNTT